MIFSYLVGNKCICCIREWYISHIGLFWDFSSNIAICPYRSLTFCDLIVQKKSFCDLYIHLLNSLVCFLVY
jgi:hypothetical protein